MFVIKFIKYIKSNVIMESLEIKLVLLYSIMEQVGLVIHHRLPVVR